MKKFNFSLVVILMMIFASSVSAQLVNRTAAIDRLQGEVVELASDPTFGLSPTVPVNTVAVESAAPANKIMVTNRLAYHKTVLEILLLDTQIGTAAALVKAPQQFAQQLSHPLDAEVMASLHADVVDLLN